MLSLIFLFIVPEQFCDPSVRVSTFALTFSMTAPNGMCSYGVGNVGTYNSSFAITDISKQVFKNPAGQYNYTQLIDQAVNQIYVITDLFNNSNIPDSLFSAFLPDDTMPTTAFLHAPAPSKSTTDTSPSTTNISPSTKPDYSGTTNQEGDIVSLVLSCTLMAMFASLA